MQIDVFKVQAVQGGATAAILSAALEALEGVSAVEISQPDGRTTIKYDDKLIARGAIDTAVATAGFRVVQPASCCGACGG